MMTSAFPNPVNPATTSVIDHRVPRFFRIEVNGRELELCDPTPDGRQILLAAGLEPADEHVLIEVLHPGTRSIELEQKVDLQGPKPKVFRAFRSDRLYLFTLDGLGYEWGASVITEKELRALGDIPDDRIIVLDRSHGEEQVLAPDARVNLAEAGTEHLRSAMRLVRVFIDDVEKFIPRGKHTTEELLKLLDVTAGYLLNVLEHGQLKALQPGQVVDVKEGMKFYSQAPGGGSA